MKCELNCPAIFPPSFSTVCANDQAKACIPSWHRSCERRPVLFAKKGMFLCSYVVICCAARYFVMFAWLRLAVLCLTAPCHAVMCIQKPGSAVLCLPVPGYVLLSRQEYVQMYKTAQTLAAVIMIVFMITGSYFTRSAFPCPCSVLLDIIWHLIHSTARMKWPGYS